MASSASVQAHASKRSRASQRNTSTSRQGESPALDIDFVIVAHCTFKMLSRQLGGGLAPLIAPSSRIRASLGHGICQRAPNAQSLRFRNSFGPKRRKHPVILAANGEGGPEGGDPSSPDEGPLENSLLFRLIIQYPAVRGTIAVALGYLAHVQPLGTLRWDPHAALIGLLFALPVAFVDAFIMLPSWEAPRTSRKMKVLVPQSLADKIAARKGPSSFSAVFRPSANPEAGSSAAIGAEAAPATTSTATAVAERPGDEMQSSSDASSAGVETVKDENPGMVEMERTVMVRGEQHPFRDALHRTQVDRAMNNVGRVLSPPAEALLLLLVHVSEEMLYRGVMLVSCCGAGLVLLGVFDRSWSCLCTHFLWHHILHRLSQHVLVLNS